MLFTILNIVGYTCEKKGCHWSRYVKNQDWGYYSETDGDCFKCQDQCNKDANCGAVECGEGYCSWWKVGKCSKADEFTDTFNTCRKS